MLLSKLKFFFGQFSKLKLTDGNKDAVNYEKLEESVFPLSEVLVPQDDGGR